MCLTTVGMHYNPGMMFRALAATESLRAFVAGYWFLEDRLGAYAGKPIYTSPFPGAVLSVNFGRPNQMIGGPMVPKVSLLGLQEGARAWRSWENTAFVMAMLTVRGVGRLFPHLGGASANALIDLGALIGDRETRQLAQATHAAKAPSKIAHALDDWLLARIDRTPALSELRTLSVACEALKAGASVDAAAREAHVSRRQLYRWSVAHFGVGPKVLAEIQRLDASVRAAQTGQGDMTHGFADQAHQIRTWRRRLKITPGRYRRSDLSPMAATFIQQSHAPSFYL